MFLKSVTWILDCVYRKICQFEFCHQVDGFLDLLTGSPFWGLGGIRVVLCVEEGQNHVMGKCWNLSSRKQAQQRHPLSLLSESLELSFPINIANNDDLRQPNKKVMHMQQNLTFSAGLMSSEYGRYIMFMPGG